MALPVQSFKDIEYLQSLNLCDCKSFSTTLLLTQEALTQARGFSQVFHNKSGYRHHRIYYNCPCKLLEASLTLKHDTCEYCTKVKDEIHGEGVQLYLSQLQEAARLLELYHNSKSQDTTDEDLTEA